MDAIASEALAHLTTAVTSLLPPVADPTLSPAVLVTPLRIVPTGLGGYAGLHTDPAGEILGRRVSARVTVSVAADDVAGLDAAVTEVTNAVMTTGRSDLSTLGILRLVVGELGPRPVPAPGPPAARRDVSFEIVYEFLKLPEQADGVIETIPLDIDGALGTGDVRAVLRGPFAAGALMQFDVVDDPLATTGGPSAWSHDAAESALAQTSAIRGGLEDTTADKPGTYLVLRASPARPPLLDLSIAATVRSDVPGGLGFVFRFLDADNFYYALLDSRTGFRRIAKKVAGVFAPVAEGGFDDAAGFVTGGPLRIRLVAMGDSFQLRHDGQIVLEAKDGDLAGAGRVGLLARHCTGARFYDCTILRL